VAVNDTGTVAGVAIELLRAYAPPRPVRLLGVRMATFEEPGDDEAETGGDGGADAGARAAGPQLALPL